MIINIIYVTREPLIFIIAFRKIINVNLSCPLIFLFITCTIDILNVFITRISNVIILLSNELDIALDVNIS